jgi:hypothetical protein
MELLVICKISPNPSFPKRGKDRKTLPKRVIFPPFGKGRWGGIL